MIVNLSALHCTTQCYLRYLVKLILTVTCSINLLFRIQGNAYFCTQSFFQSNIDCIENLLLFLCIVVIKEIDLRALLIEDFCKQF